MEINNTMDQYEKQLYTLFSSYDSAHNGSLSREALEELCGTLQLENRGRQLIELLLGDSKETRITFPIFRDGLLTVLGNDTSESPVKILDRSDLNSGEDSSGREISPKYTFGSKKYGRRSKPPRTNEPSDYIEEGGDEISISSQESSEIVNNNIPTISQEKVIGCKKRRNNTKLKRSLSFSGHNIYETSNNSSDCVLPRQLSLRTDDYTSNHMPAPPSSAVRGSSNTGDLDMFDFNRNNQVNASQPNDLSKRIDINGLSANELSMGCLEPSEEREDCISERGVSVLWEESGIPHPRQLLCDLGFGDRFVLSELVYTLEEEIQSMLNNLPETFSARSLITLFQAVLCLYQYEKKCLKLSADHAFAERDKLRTDLSDANQRAVLLAHEVDDNHAKMENAAKNNFKQMEQKHSEVLKQLTEQSLLEKEISNSALANLENKISCMEGEESKLRWQMTQSEAENARLEKELIGVQEQLFELLDIKKQLSKEIIALNNEKRDNWPRDTARENEITHLQSQISKLQQENIVLKDRNDELCTELESNKIPSVKQAEGPLTIANALGINGVKRRGESPTQAADIICEEEIPRICKLRKYHKNNLIPFEDNLLKNDLNLYKDDLSSSENNSLISNFDSENQDLDMLMCIKHLTPANIEELTTLFKATTNIFSNFFTHSQMKHYYLGLNLLLKKVMNDMKKTVDIYKNLVNNSLDSDVTNLIQKLVAESCSINVENHNLLFVLYNFDNHCYQAPLDRLITDNKSILDEKEKTGTNMELASRVSILEQKIKELNDLLQSERCTRGDERLKELEKYNELESNMELLKTEYDKCEDYWSCKVNEERELFDQEQRITDEKFGELLSKLSEYEEQFASQDTKNDRFGGRLSTIEEKYSLEKQFTDLEEEFEEYRLKTEEELNLKSSEIKRLKEQLEQLEKSKIIPPKVEASQENKNVSNIESSLIKDNNVNENTILGEQKCPFSSSDQAHTNYSNNIIEKISSPIDYLWHQSTIPSPLPNVRNNNIDVTRDYHNPAFSKDPFSEQNNGFIADHNVAISNSIMPIQKPVSSIINNITQSFPKQQNKLFKEKKMLYCSELEEELQGRRKEVQHLEATRARLDAEVRALNVQLANPHSQMSATALKAVALENYCRQLQASLRQQHSYAEALMQQSLAAHRGEVGVLRQKLAASDLLVRDLYVENCHLARSLTTSVSK